MVKCSYSLPGHTVRNRAKWIASPFGVYSTRRTRTPNIAEVDETLFPGNWLFGTNSLEDPIYAQGV
jgi:hypothetical protein